MIRGLFSLLTLAAIGAIIGDVLMHPRGVATTTRGINAMLSTLLRGAAGRG